MTFPKEKAWSNYCSKLIFCIDSMSANSFQVVATSTNPLYARNPNWVGSTRNQVSALRKSSFSRHFSSFPPNPQFLVSWWVSE